MLLEIEHCKFSMEFIGEPVSSMGRIFGAIKEASVKRFLMYFYPGSPFPQTIVFHEGNSNEATHIIYVFASISIVLFQVAFPEIIFPVIQCVVILVISFTWATAQNFVMQVKTPNFSSALGIETSRFRIPIGIPVPCTDAVKVLGIYDGVLPLRKRDKAVRCVKRLDNRVAFHAKFLSHWSSLKGLLLNSAAILT
jgi:hypothetical protein